MSVEAPLVACPHCGGAIKAEAKLCKHCRRSVTAPVGTEAQAPGPRMAPESAMAMVVTDLESFLDKRGVVVRTRTHPILVGAETDDAAVALGHLASGGLIAPAQVESVREQFRSHQAQALKSILDAALGKKLLQPGQTVAAAQEFDSQCFRVSPREYVVSAGLMTNEQLGSTGTGFTLAGLTLAGLKEKVGKKGIIGAAVVLLLVIGLIMSRPNIEYDGTMSGRGSGVMTFTNSGRFAGSICGHVVVVCASRVHRGTRFCSGTVEPGQSLNVPFAIAGMNEIMNRCGWDFYAE